MTVSPNDKLIATGSQDRLAKLWSCSDCSLLGVFAGHKRGIWCVQFSPVDQVLATSSADGTLKLWGLQDFSCLKVMTTQTAPCSSNPCAVRGLIKAALEKHVLVRVQLQRSSVATLKEELSRSSLVLQDLGSASCMGSSRRRASAQRSSDLSFLANRRAAWLIVGEKHIHAVERKLALPDAAVAMKEKHTSLNFRLAP